MDVDQARVGERADVDPLAVVSAPGGIVTVHPSPWKLAPPLPTTLSAGNSARRVSRETRADVAGTVAVARPGE
jgi:hypothetical protein